ncbi:PD-(D/E)XK nuclease family protein [Lentibacillus sp. N15]|uniref:PD-(D/E)XK nuclease family protein n=1 Tax=Lentibacillus songyuanensis TaxID=3136161 RepID=UPI0031BB6B20
MMMDTFSFSRLSLYQTCPYRFYRKYVDKVPEPTTLPLALGKAVHKAIEDKMKGVSHSEAILNGLVEAKFHPEVNIEELSKLTSRAPLHKIKGETEVYFKIPLSNESNTPKIQGFIDVIDGNQIFDWKTNRVPYDIKDTFQIALYAWAMSQVKGIHEVTGTLFFLRFRRRNAFVFRQQEMEQARVWAYRTAKEIQGKLDIVKMIPELRDELFHSTPSSYCSHCPLAIECFKKFSPIATVI